jgi:dihydroorotate dehydrogenase
MINPFSLAKPLLHTLDPERAHALTIAALEKGVYPRPRGPAPEALKVSAFGTELPNPIGIAAGFDKDARVANALTGMGFGFAEVGTLTPRPQEGNPKPRNFRLPADGAIINRNGFNNCGHEAALARLEGSAIKGCVGVNLGANKDSDDRVADYVAGVSRFAHLARYFMVNVSSPNTPGLRNLQAPDEIDRLLSRVIAERDRMAATVDRKVPVAIKLAPDIADDDLEPILDRIRRHDVAAIAISNTTIARPATLKSPPELVAEAGGLSGHPLFEPSTRMLARAFRIVGRDVPLIGIGGIDTGARAVAKVRAGATLIQLYTGLVYRGPELLDEIKDAMLLAVKSDPDVRTIADLIGKDADDWAVRPGEA